MNWLWIFLGFTLLIFLHECGHFVAAKATGMRVERFFLFFGPTLWSFKRGETEYGVKAIPLGGYVKISGMTREEEVPEGSDGRLYYEQPVWKRIVAIGAGPAVNIVLAFAILFGVYLASFNEYHQTVSEIRPDTPAAKVLEPGDRIVAVDGNRYARLDTEGRLDRFGKQVGSHKCAGKQIDGCVAATPVELLIRRDGQLQKISVRPEYDQAAGKPLIGFSYALVPTQLSPGGAADVALDRMWMVTSGTVHVLSHIFEKEERKEISGVVGTSDRANQIIDFGVAPALLMLALVSLSLGVINLLPILPLDGGHIFWALVEKLRGRPASLRAMERASVIGFALVAVLFVIGLSNDLGRLGGDAFTPR